MTMLSLFNPILPIHQIEKYQLPFPKFLNPISNGAAANTQNNLSRFTIVCFSSAASNSLQEIEPVFDFFHSYGFTDTQIKRFNDKCPSFRSTLMIKPKLEHLLAFGFSPSDLIKMICYDPGLLVTSLKNRIEPNLNLLETTIGSKAHIIKAIKKGPFLLRIDLEKHVIPNIKILRENAIPTDNIIRLFTVFPRVLEMDPNVIIETISKLKGLGINPLSISFIYGMNTVVMYKKETWERKMEIYRSLGWSETDTLLAFSRQPNCMTLSDDKIKKNMEFFVEKLQWDSAMVIRWPVVLMYSLEGRIVPRCAVLNVLAKNGLWERKSKISMFTMSEEKFKERYVDKYEKEVPKVIDAYQGKIDFVGFESIDG